MPGSRNIASDLWLHDKETKERSKIAENCYLHTSCDNNTKRSILNYLFKELNIPTGVLEFELAPIADKVIDTEDE